MNKYIALLDKAGLSYGYLFCVKAENKNEAKDKVCVFCKDKGYYRNKKELKIYTLDEMFDENKFMCSKNLDVMEII